MYYIQKIKNKLLLYKSILNNIYIIFEVICLFYLFLLKRNTAKDFRR